MQDLRLVAANESGTHLVLRSQVGEKYLLAIDERLRAAVRGDRARLGQLEIQTDGQLRPRDIQAQIRAGATAEQVAKAAGVPVDRVRRFEGPVLAEREHMAQMAQRGAIRRPGQGDGRATTLGEAVTARMDPLKIKPEELGWDSWRRDDGRWLVQLAYEYDDENRTARFVFDFRARTIAPEDDEGRWIVGELDQRPKRAPFVPRLAGSAEALVAPPAVAPPAPPMRTLPRSEPAPSGIPASIRGDHPAGRKLPGAPAARVPERPAPAPAPAPAPTHSPAPAAPAARRAAPAPAAGPPRDAARPAATAPAARAAVQPSASSAPPAPRVPEKPKRVAPLDFLVPPVPGGAEVPAPARREPAPRPAQPGRLGNSPAARRPGIRSDLLGTRTPRRSVLDVPAGVPAGAPAAATETEPVEHRRTGTHDARPAGTGPRRRASVPSWDDIMFGTRRRD